MSVQPKFDVFQAVTVAHPIVLRFANLDPAQLPRLVAHYVRKGGDLRHTRKAFSRFNEILAGVPEWAADLDYRIRQARIENFQNRYRALTTRNRKKEIREWIRKLGLEKADGTLTAADIKKLDNPWNGNCKYALREGLLTANKKFFGGSGFENWDDARVLSFREEAMAFLRSHFPGEQMIYAEGHMDEEAYHIHFVVACWTEKETLNRGRQILLQPSVNELIKNYELAQDVAGLHFSDLGLVRGERRAEARRAAIAAGQDPGPKRYHIKPSSYRETEIREGREVAQQIIEVARAQADELAAVSLKAVRRKGSKMSRRQRAEHVRAAKARKAADEKALAALSKTEARREGLEVQAQAAEARMAVAVDREAQASQRVQDFEQQGAEVEIQVALQQVGVGRLRAQRDALSAEVQDLQSEVRELAQKLRDLRLIMLAHNAEHGEKGNAALQRIKLLRLDDLDGPFVPDEGWVHQARAEIENLHAEMDEVRLEQFDRWLRVGAAEAKTENQQRFILNVLRRVTQNVEKSVAHMLSNLGEGVDGYAFLDSEKYQACLQRMYEILASDPCEGRDADWPYEFEMVLWLVSHAQVESTREVERRRQAREAAEAAQRRADAEMREAILIGLQAITEGRLLMRSGPEGFVASSDLEPGEAKALLHSVEPGAEWLRALSRKMFSTFEAAFAPQAEAMQRNIALLEVQSQALRTEAHELLGLRDWDNDQRARLEEISRREAPDFE